MSVGGVSSVGTPIALPLNRSPVEAVKRIQPSQEKKTGSVTTDGANASNAASSAIASGSADPNRGKNLDISA